MPGFDSSNTTNLKAEILRRIQAGERGVEIARALGVSRQYVSRLHKELEKESAEAILARRRKGRPRHRPLTAEQEVSLRERLVAGQTPTGRARPGLTEGVVKTWFRDTHGRTLSVHELRKFCTDEGLKLARPADEEEQEFAEPSVNEEAPRKSRRRGKEIGFGNTSRMSADDLATMARSNAEVAERIAAKRGQPTPKRSEPKTNRNAPCPCGSGKKFKKCCG